MADLFSSYQAHGISREIFDLSEEALRLSRSAMQGIDRIREKRQLDVLAAFHEARVSESGFMAKTGYGYDDLGRQQTEAVFARALGAQDALVRIQFSSGTQVLATCLKALLSPGDGLLIVTGRPYDSLIPTLGRIQHTGSPSPEFTDLESRQSLSARGVSIGQVDLLAGGAPDLEGIRQAVGPQTRMVYIQKSRGYSDRPALLNRDIQAIASLVKELKQDVIVFVDHCYSEFVEEFEPTQAGADLIAGSLIKNPGSGLAPGGGYIAGRQDLVQEISQGMTAIGVGREVGPAFGMTRLLLQGLYLAPTVVATALKGAVLTASLFSLAGFEVSPEPHEVRGDIVQLIRLGSPDLLQTFCGAIQAASPIDSFVRPLAAPMPGYDCDIIMASGSFIQGSTIELSADGPLRPPYHVFMQGGLTFEQIRLGAMRALQEIGKASGDR